MSILNTKLVSLEVEKLMMETQNMSEKLKVILVILNRLLN